MRSPKTIGFTLVCVVLQHSSAKPPTGRLAGPSRRGNAVCGTMQDLPSSTPPTTAPSTITSHQRSPETKPYPMHGCRWAVSEVNNRQSVSSGDRRCYFTSSVRLSDQSSIVCTDYPIASETFPKSRVPRPSRRGQGTGFYVTADQTILPPPPHPTLFHYAVPAHSKWTRRAGGADNQRTTASIRYTVSSACQQLRQPRPPDSRCLQFDATLQQEDPQGIPAIP